MKIHVFNNRVYVLCSLILSHYVQHGTMKVLGFIKKLCLYKNNN